MANIYLSVFTKSSQSLAKIVNNLPRTKVLNKKKTYWKNPEGAEIFLGVGWSMLEKKGQKPPKQKKTLALTFKCGYIYEVGVNLNNAQATVVSLNLNRKIRSIRDAPGFLLSKCHDAIRADTKM